MERPLIDLGTRPQGHDLPYAVLDADRIDYLVDALDIAELPVVLDVHPRFDDVSKHLLSLQRGHDGLVADGLLPDGRIHPAMAAWMRILEQPDWYVAARLVPRPVTENGPATRACFASNEDGSVIAVRTGRRITIRATSVDPSRELLDTLGMCAAHDFRSISAPTDDLAEALDASPTDHSATTDRLAHLGIDPSDAAEVAAAMALCFSHAEITSVTTTFGARAPGRHPVAVFDTHRGRLVATSSTATDGRQWTTLSPGHDARVRGALAELVERARVS
ncbi:ESX secretion-associated protein EspG [Rhodococcoides yunnanense]|uniref:ESX secretion-associated protein EspG n=1 Tax=Rhodococcoides yunnanense TaxID=278209 RepID=UPI001FE6BD61|nr:ESX secretion-associated protein EspG [Rhodococcus yunnanensis]